MKPAPDVAFVEVEGELVLMNPRAEHYYALDDVGARCWQLLEEHDGDLERVVASMLAEFDVEEPKLRSDVEALMDKLADAGLVVATDPAV